MTEHTSTPWKRQKRNDGHKVSRMIVSSDGQSVAWIGHGNDDIAEANAAYVVKCVNAHEALVKALQWFADHSNWREEELSEGVYFSAEWKIGFDPIMIARTALAKAEQST